MIAKKANAKMMGTLGLSLAALFSFTACGDNSEDDNANNTPVATPVAPDVTQTGESSPSATTDDDDQNETQSASASESATTASGKEGVFDALDVVEKEYPNGTVISIDRDDADTRYEIDVVDGDKTLELQVENGTITVKETENEVDSEARQAADAATDIRTALKTATKSVSDQTVDDVELDDDVTPLRWEIDFDKADGTDGDKVFVDATSGEIVSR